MFMTAYIREKVWSSLKMFDIITILESWDILMELNIFKCSQILFKIKLRSLYELPLDFYKQCYWSITDIQ